jgi:tetratricopeptide (TPR) repeat protein
MKINPKYFIFLCFLSIFFVFFFHANLKADNKEAKKYLRKAERHIKNKEIKNAAEMMENAIKSDPTNGYYDFYTGYIYLYNTENRKKALEYLKSAESKGYTSPLLYHRKGMCYFHLKQFFRAIKVIKKSITLNKEKLEEAQNRSDKSKINALNKEIANSYVWLTKQYDALNMPLEYHKAALFGYEHNPKDQWLPGLVKKSWLPLGHYYFAEKKYEKAAEAYKTAEKNGTKWRWLPEVINIVERLKGCPRPDPEYVHKIAAVYVKENILIRKSDLHVINDDI